MHDDKINPCEWAGVELLFCYGLCVVLVQRDYNFCNLHSQNMATPHDILFQKVLKDVLGSIKSKVVKVSQDFKAK